MTFALASLSSCGFSFQLIFNFHFIPVTGSNVVRPTIDDVSIRLELENGTQVTINNSRIYPNIQRNFRFVKNNEVQVVNTATLEVEMVKPLTEDPYQTVTKHTLEKKDALALEVDHFIRAVRGEHPVMITGEEALLALKQVEQFVTEIS